MYINGLYLRTIACLLHTSATSVLSWVRKFALENYEKLQTSSEAVVIQLDEMWHFLNFKKQALDMESILCWYKATHWLGMWQLWYQYTLRIYITDYWKPYTEIIPKGLLLQNKKYVHSIERNNSRQRHWFARFRRKTYVVSRSLEMVDLTMTLFAKFHCNSSFSFPSLFT